MYFATQGEENNYMKLIWKLRIWKDTRGQDLIEYALMAGFVAVAAGAIMPGVATSISQIFSKIGSVMTNAAAQGGAS
jgi:pilus assembly protein Flp/PilA